MIRTILLISILSPVLIAACDVNASSISPKASTDELKQQATEPLFAGTYTNEPGNCGNVQLHLSDNDTELVSQGVTQNQISFSAHEIKRNKNTAEFGLFTDVFYYQSDSKYFVMTFQKQNSAEDERYSLKHYSSLVPLTNHENLMQAIKGGPFVTAELFPCEDTFNISRQE